MHPKKALDGLTFVNEVTSKKQTYYVYKGVEHYVLMTFNKTRSSYSLNVVAEEACEYVRRLFAGESQVTTAQVVEKSKKPVLVKENFEALNVLYTLCATGAAKIDKRFKGKKLYFNVYSIK